jgi:NitT/TauT family transport system substrate-binding protein
MLKLTLPRLIRTVVLAVITFGLLVACNSQQPATQTSPTASTPQVSSKPLIVGSSPWAGFAGHYVALAKDFFKEEGITVEDQYFQVATDVNTALQADKLDIAWTGIPDMVIMASRDPSFRLIMLSDYSNGADGILARGIAKPEDLKGKKVAWESLPLQALLLRKYLEKGGLTEKDIQLVVLPAADSATAFTTKKVDVAVTYDPYLTNAAKQGQGQVIFSSKDSNIIPDGLAGKASVIESRRADILAFLRAIDKGVKFVREKPDEAADIIAKKLGVSKAEVPGLLATVKTFSVEENKTTVFNPSNPLNVMDSLKFAAKTGKELNLLTNPVDAKTLYDDSLVKGI